MKNFEHLKYTYLHRKALYFTIQKLIRDDTLRKVLIDRAKYHDLDKALLYTLIEKKEASAYHRAHAKHHMENSNTKSYVDYVEAILDYECAALTKPDKPLNAYDTILKFKVNNSDELLKITSLLGIDRSYKVHPDKDWEDYVSKFLPVTEEAIMQEIYEYCIKRPNDAFGVVSYAKSLLK